MEYLGLYKDNAPVADNLLPAFYDFSEFYTLTITSGSGSGNIGVDTTPYSGEKSLIDSNYSSTDLILNAGNNFKGIAPEDGYYLFSFFAKVESPYAAENISVNFRWYVNSVLTETYNFILGEDTFDFVFDSWNGFYQQIPLNQGDEYNFDIVVNKDTSSAVSFVKFSLDSFCLQFNNKSLAYPAMYQRPAFRDTGWAIYKDATWTSGTPQTVTASTLTTIQNLADGINLTEYLPSDVTAFYTPIGNKLISQGTENFNHIVIRFKVKSTVDYDAIEVGIDFGGSVGVAFKQSQRLVKLAGNYQDVQFSFDISVFTEYATNGGVPKIIGTGDLSIYGAEYTIARLFKR